MGSENGQYDNVGFRYRGHHFTNGQGKSVLQTIIPGKYPGRLARHIHVTITNNDSSRSLTSQIYFLSDATEENDFGWDRRNAVQDLHEHDGAWHGTFAIALETP